MIDLKSIQDFLPSKDDPEAENWGGWKNKAWKVPSHAIVVVGHSSCVMFYEGVHIDYEIAEVGDPMCDEAFRPAPPDNGIWWWTGRTNGMTYYDGECDCWLEGEFRRLTDDELAMVARGESPLPQPDPDLKVS